MTAPMISDLEPKSTRNRRYHQRIKNNVRWTEPNGRVWIGTRDKETGHPTGGLRLHPSYQPPYATLIPIIAHYFQFDDEDEGRVTIDYRQWRIDAANDEARWKQSMLKVALEKNQTAETVEALPPLVHDIVGKRPMAEIFIAAMERGNRWALGIPNKHGVLDPVPAFATPALLQTLVRVETTHGSGETSDFDDALFANPDDDGFVPPELDDDAEEAAARLEAQDNYADLDDEHPPTPRTPVRGHKGQFLKKPT